MLTSHIILFLSLTLPGLIIDAQENGDENENENKLGSAKNHLHLWTYVDQEEWKSQYPSCEAPGIRQSPIDIETKKVVVDSDRKLTFVNYDVDTKLKLVNNHHTISIEPIEVTKTPSVKSSWLNREFELAEIHFHWGDGQTVGSEHKIDGQSSLAEAHFVHILKGISRNQTKDIPDSILVIGVLIEPEELNSVNGINLADNFDTILKDFNIVDGNDDEYLGIKPIALNKLLPENTNEFYSYDGSLTTPPCYEVVSWVVMNNKAQVSRDNVSVPTYMLIIFTIYYFHYIYSLISSIQILYFHN